MASYTNSDPLTMTDTFGNQVIATTGIDITDDTSISKSDVTLFLQEGYRDVVNQVSKTKPHELHLFSYTWGSPLNSGTQDSNSPMEGSDHVLDQEITGDGFHIPSGIIINVWRANGRNVRTVNQCTQINASLKDRAQDRHSLSYRGKQNPCYYWENGKVFILPEPYGIEYKEGVTGIAGENISLNFAQVSFIRYELIDFDTDTVSLIPDVYTRLIVMYAALKLLETKMANFVLEDEDQELASGIQANIGVLTQKYQSHFATPAPAGGGGQQGGRR